MNLFDYQINAIKQLNISVAYLIEQYESAKMHISEYSDRNAGVQPDTFAMRFSRV